MKNYLSAMFALCACAIRASATIEQKPNVVVILADDLGYGDVHCLNPERGKIPTPCMDRLATQGMTFTDAHGSSSVCTPSRYGLLTGRYAWRTRLQQQVLFPYDKPLIAADRLTVPALFKQHGYVTACIGKWHLGMNSAFRSKELEQKCRQAAARMTPADWEMLFSLRPDSFDLDKPITDGPTTRGFDYFFGEPFGRECVSFIENDRQVGLRPDLSPKSTPHMLDPEAKEILPEVLPALTDRACDYIRRHAVHGKPFFVYFALTAPHTPLVPTKEWKGKSGLGDYGDFVMETDAMIGRVLETIEQSGLAGNTLVIVTSDNGCAPYIGVDKLEAKGHFPSAQFRGYKSDIWVGGHRIPFVVRWPGTIKPGITCGQLVCLNGLMATCADLLGVKLPANAGEDSVSFLPLLRGENQPVRTSVIHHSFDGKFAIREGKWKLEFCPGSGGWTTPNDAAARKQKLPPVQLYDLSQDIGERTNLEAEHPEIVKRLTALLEQIVTDGRSTPGPKQRNDVPVDIFKKGS